MRRANAPYASFFRTGGRYSYIFGQAFSLLLRARVGVGRRSLMRGAAGQAFVTAARRVRGSRPQLIKPSMHVFQGSASNSCTEKDTTRESSDNATWKYQ